MTKPTAEIFRTGALESAPTLVPLRAGPLTLVFDPSLGSLRYIRIGDHEIVRHMYVVVRDEQWRTPHPQIENIQVKSGNEGFGITFEARCAAGGIDFRWRGAVEGNAAGCIRFQFDGESFSDFRRNRIGLCVLHPLVECVGKACTLEHPDGASEQTAFPRFISPHQPFKNIRAMSHEPAPGVRARLEFEGEVFETEDQRNWCDASFKTYSTPLGLPVPVQVRAGDRIQQAVTLTLPGASRKILPVVQGRPPQLSIATTPVLARPPVGLGMASHGGPFSDREAARLRSLGLGHLRVDLHLNDSSHIARLREAAAQGRQLDVALQVALFLGDGAEAILSDLARELETLKARIALWLVFREGEASTSEKWVALARQKLAASSPNILFAAGANGPFTEVNRSRPASDATALPCYAINPQTHLWDNTTLMENLAAMPYQVESMQQFCPRAVVVSPITLRRRFHATDPTYRTPPPGELPPQVDTRQMSLLCAAWMVGSLARLATTPGLHSLTYFETTGWRGIMETEAGSPLPSRFPSIPGGVFPVYHVIADLKGFGRVYPTQSSLPLQVEGITLLDSSGQRRLLVANLTPETQEFKIKTGVCKARARLLDEASAEQAMREPELFRAQPGLALDATVGKIELRLTAWASACVDLTG